MIETVTTFRTADGCMHSTLQDAQKHEAFNVAVSALEDALASLYSKPPTTPAGIARFVLTVLECNPAAHAALSNWLELSRKDVVG